MKEKIAKKMSRWKEKMLSIGGREILRKAVAQAIPTYTMSWKNLLVGVKRTRIKNSMGQLEESLQIQANKRHGI